MKLNFDLYGSPPPIVIGSGDNQFSLTMRRATSFQRMALIDAVGSGSYAAAWAVVTELITGWEGVFNSDGAKIPFEGVDAQTQQPVRNATRVFAAMPMAVQVEVLAALMAFGGIPTDALKPMIAAINAATGSNVDLDPTRPPQQPTGGGASAP